MAVFFFVMEENMIYQNPNTGISQPIPRHREINERLAKKIIKDLTND